MLLIAMGAVVEGLSCDSHTPLSGHRSPVLAVVPIGFFTDVYLHLDLELEAGVRIYLYETVCQTTS